MSRKSKYDYGRYYCNRDYLWTRTYWIITFYYENDKLLIKTVYSSVKGNYTNEVFFDGGLSIKTFYEDNVRKKDIYYENGSEKRIVNYE